jgi:hypothetical protein
MEPKLLKLPNKKTSLKGIFAQNQRNNKQFFKKMYLFGERRSRLCCLAASILYEDCLGIDEKSRDIGTVRSHGNCQRHAKNE